MLPQNIRDVREREIERYIYRERQRVGRERERVGRERESKSERL